MIRPRPRFMVAQHRLHTLCGFCVAAIVLAALIGWGRPSGTAAASLDGVWESAESVAVIQNTCGMNGPFEILDATTFPVQVRHHGAALQVSIGGIVSVRGESVSPRGFTAELPIEVRFFTEGVFSSLRQQVVFSESNGAAARYVLVIELSSRSDGAPDCHLKLSGIAKRVGVTS